ncbi:MAG: CRISPR-associated protein Cse1 [Chloroflexota bacterium]|nr:CRISPR-associated protein Cse1 [Chloroflexota bacterium]MDE2959653.1 CRISPR-associated protein Cse1 [Chloroflexota bacterium]
MLNILTEPLIGMTTAEGTRPVSLPEVYAVLMADEVEAFPALRPHQRHAWHASLVQLAAMAMHRAGVAEPPADEVEWAGLIRGLTADWTDDEPWQLVVDDITKPAFMQPPARSADKLAEYKSRVETADELDMLVTSKNHDLKATVGAQSGVDDWIYALISLQTMEGFGGAGNYGISRMNGGLGSRPAFSMAPTGRVGAHVKRDIRALLDNYPTTGGGHRLLWLLSWDGTASERLLPNQLAPHYIEVCRRVRLRSDADGRLYAVRTSTKAARIEGKDLKGRTGDPWTPHNPNRDGLPLTISRGGFNYKRVTEYLFDWQNPDLLKATPDEQRSNDPDETMQLVARAMVRGQGKTEGYYERVIPIRSKKALRGMTRRPGSDSTEDLGNLAQERIKEVGIVQGILRHAIATFLARGESRETSPEQRALANPWANRLDEIVDADFFDALQVEFEHNDRAERERVRNEWLMNGRDGVVDHARNILDEAVDSLPCPAVHRYRARENAEGLFEGRIRRSGGLPFLFDRTNFEVTK